MMPATGNRTEGRWAAALPTRGFRSWCHSRRSPTTLPQATFRSGDSAFPLRAPWLPARPGGSSVLRGEGGYGGSFSVDPAPLCWKGAYVLADRPGCPLGRAPCVQHLPGPPLAHRSGYLLLTPAAPLGVPLVCSTFRVSPTRFVVAGLGLVTGLTVGVPGQKAPLSSLLSCSWTNLWTGGLARGKLGYFVMGESHSTHVRPGMLCDGGEPLHS